MAEPVSHDQNFKNLIVEYPRQALAFFALDEAPEPDEKATFLPVRQEQLKEHLGGRFRALDTPLLVKWADGRREAVVFRAGAAPQSRPRRFRFAVRRDSPPAQPHRPRMEPTPRSQAPFGVCFHASFHPGVGSRTREEQRRRGRACPVPLPTRSRSRCGRPQGSPLRPRFMLLFNGLWVCSMEGDRPAPVLGAPLGALLHRPRRHAGNGSRRAGGYLPARCCPGTDDARARHRAARLPELSSTSRASSRRCPPSAGWTAATSWRGSTW